MFHFFKHEDGGLDISPRDAFVLGLVTSVLVVGTVGFVILLILLFAGR